MSQRLNETPARSSVSPANGGTPDRSSKNGPPLVRSDAGSVHQKMSQVDDGLSSGKLEGSTLGSNRDRRTQDQRRIQSSSGFLLDSLPRARSTRESLHRPRPSETAREKRRVPEPDLVVPKKRSRFPWSRRRHNDSKSTGADTRTGPVNNSQAPSMPSENHLPSKPAQPQVQGSNTEQSVHDLDRDSLQIVNLALNLNESRRRTASGIHLGPGQRPISVSQPVAPPVDSHAQSSRAEYLQRDSAYRDFTQLPGDRMSQGTLPSLEQSSVMNLLPPSAIEDHRPYEFSESTLIRAHRARNHFNLFHQYMRLLPLLPPLQEAVKDNPPESSMPQQPRRGYNPLQMIRNRKVRYREKSTIDADAEGWHDAERVHQWINHIEQKYSEKVFNQFECLRLPPFKQGYRHLSIGEDEDMDMATISPKTSLRRASRTSSMKARRPRIDWEISPAELLADAVWLEDSSNKTKIVDKDGYKLYPDPTALVTLNTRDDNASLYNPRISVEVGDHDEANSSPHTSFSSTHPALAQESKSVGRGRHKSRLRSHPSSLRSRSGSSTRKPSRWNKVRMRSGSVSSSSSPDDRPSIDEKPRMSREHLREHVQRLVEHAQPSGSRISRARSPAARNPEPDRGRTPQPFNPFSFDTTHKRRHRRTSGSSADTGSDRFDLRMSMEGADSTAPNSPVHAGYFPSIAVNLSPPSSRSRSPSPTRKGLRHKIVLRHERSKSKQAYRDRQSDIPEIVTPRSPTALPYDHDKSGNKLGPSPLPDVVSSHYQEDQTPPQGNRTEGHRARKGDHYPESKLRGIFKGPSRIAEIVGNEVSKVGELILKKDAEPETCKSSAATLASDDSDSDQETTSDKKSDVKLGTRRLPTSIEPGRFPGRESGSSSIRGSTPSMPIFTSPLRLGERTPALDVADFGHGEKPSSPGSYGDSKRPPMSPRSKTLDFNPSLQTGRPRRHEIKDPSIPFSLTRPPVTGLARARASPGISPEGRQTRLTGMSRAWSISGRRLHTVHDTGVPTKPEIERTRALLLSSGIKAREITRRAHTTREPAPHWLQSSLGPGQSLPKVTRVNEFDLAAQNLLRRFESTQYSFQQSMHHFSTTTSSPLRLEIEKLERLINQTLAPRVRATANGAEELCVQLNTTSTLAVKQLSDALDKGVRKRRRRLRWVRRTGFMVLEWALVAMLWWVWLIVMAFKLVRGVFRGFFSAVRWVLWL